MSVTPDISVILVSLNTLDYLKRALACIPLGFKAYTTEVIVVDNGSTDGSVEYLSSLQEIRLIANQTNLGFAHANNQAFEIMQGAHAFLLNSDAFLHEACGDLLMTFLLQHPEAGLAVPTFEYPDGRWQLNSEDLPTVWKNTKAVLGINNLLHLYYKVVKKWGWRFLRPGRVGFAAGAGLLIRGEVLRDIGGFSPDYFFYGEDLDYGYRAAKAGWSTWWVPQACLTHVRGASGARKNFEAGLRAKFLAYVGFLVRNYPLQKARLIYALKYLYYQRLFMSAQLGSWIPGLRRRMRENLDIYKAVRDLYRSYLPAGRFEALKAEILGPTGFDSTIKRF